MLPKVDIKFIFCLFIAILTCCGLNLPSYIKPCSLSDPNLKSCMIQSGQNAISSLRKGDQNYKIPSVDPLKIPLIEINMGEDLSIKFSKITAYNFFEVVKIQDVDFDLEKGIFSLHLYDESGILADLTYEMKMKLMGLPITGNGEAKANVSKIDMFYEAALKTIQEDDGDHFNIDKSKFNATVGQLQFHFDNLFNGDQRLGDATNNLINENWREFSSILQPAVIDLFQGLINGYLKGIFASVPKNSLFLP
nr:protein takeout-like [Onthophagus taurus]